MRHLWVSVLLCVVVSTVSAQIDPSWTEQCWDFGTPIQFGIVPEQYNNLHGTPVAIIADLSGGQGVQWNQEGYWYGPELKIILDIPNQRIDNPYKLVWIDLVYKGEVDFSWVADVVSGKHFTKIDEQEGQTDTGWKTLHQVWYFRPNPRQELIVIGIKGETAPGMIDSICVRTHCVPEPATFAMLGLGAFVLFSAKRRKVSGLATKHG